jgi:hypothetical protein
VAQIDRILSRNEFSPRTLVATVTHHLSPPLASIEGREEVKGTVATSDAAPVTIEDRLNRLAIASRHRRQPSSLGKRDRFAAMSRCRR